MRISIFTEIICYKGGGSQIAVINYALGLMELGHEPKIITISNKYAKNLLEKYKIPYCFLKNFPAKKTTFDLINAYRTINTDKPDLIFVNEAFSTFWIGKMCGKILNIPVLAFFHTYYFKNQETKSDFINTILENLTIIYLRLCYASLNHFATATKSAKKFLVSRVKIKNDKIKICPYPVFKNSLVKIKRKSVENGCIKFLYAGRIVKGKNVDLLLETLNRLEYLDWKLTIVGDGSQKKKVLELIKSFSMQNKVVYKPFMNREELLKEYANYDYFISLSDMETFGFTYLEALKENLSVICLKYSTTIELFSNIQNVIMLETKNPPLLAKQIDDLLTNKFKHENGYKKKKLKPFYFEPYVYKTAAMKLIEGFK